MSSLAPRTGLSTASLALALLPSLMSSPSPSSSSSSSMSLRVEPRLEVTGLAITEFGEGAGVPVVAKGLAAKGLLPLANVAADAGAAASNPELPAAKLGGRSSYSSLSHSGFTTWRVAWARPLSTTRPSMNGDTRAAPYFFFNAPHTDAPRFAQIVGTLDTFPGSVAS